MSTKILKKRECFLFEAVYYTLPRSDTPRFKYRVPAKWRLRRAIKVKFTKRPNKVHFRCRKAPCTSGKRQWVAFKLPTVASNSDVK